MVVAKSDQGGEIPDSNLSGNHKTNTKSAVA